MGSAGPTAAAHSTNAPFARLDGAAAAQYDLPGELSSGQTLFFKFQSYNIFGGGLEDLSTCAVYTFVTSTRALADPIFAQLQTGFALDLGEVDRRADRRGRLGLFNHVLVHLTSRPGRDRRHRQRTRSRSSSRAGSPLDLGLTTGSGDDQLTTSARPTMRWST